MRKERVLVAVKTYPTVSSKYQLLSCSAGFRADGTLIWLYPLPLAKSAYGEQYKKFQWLELELRKHDKDFRKESFRPGGKVRVAGSLSAAGRWEARKKLVLGKVYSSLDILLAEARDKDEQRRTSLAVFRPAEVCDLAIKPCAREWSADKLNVLRQGNLFEKRRGEFDVIPKLPYQFYYRFKDCRGRSSKLMVQDWELGAAYWKALKKTGGSEQAACRLVKQEYLDRLVAEREIYFILGTTLQFQAKKAPNPFIIVGVFAPPKERQLSFSGF